MMKPKECDRLCLRARAEEIFMLTFYHHPLSPVSRRAWLGLLEKELAFEAKVVDLAAGAQKQPEFTALNPFGRVPVLVDGDARIIESLAILDYLEARYPMPSLLPAAPEAIATVRMVEMVVANEIMPKAPAIVLASDALLASEPAAREDPAVRQIETTLAFLEDTLGSRAYFGGDVLSLADLVAGATIPLLCRLGISLDADPALAAWHERIGSRSAWRTTEPSDRDFTAWKRWVKIQIERRQAKERQP